VCGVWRVRVGVVGDGEGDGGEGDGFAEEPAYALLFWIVQDGEIWGKGKSGTAEARTSWRMGSGSSERVLFWWCCWSVFGERLCCCGLGQFADKGKERVGLP